MILSLIFAFGCNTWMCVEKSWQFDMFVYDITIFIYAQRKSIYFRWSNRDALILAKIHNVFNNI